jgi:hypothetical protein
MRWCNLWGNWYLEAPTEGGAFYSCANSDHGACFSLTEKSVMRPGRSDVRTRLVVHAYRCAVDHTQIECCSFDCCVEYLMRAYFLLAYVYVRYTPRSCVPQSLFPTHRHISLN